MDCIHDIYGWHNPTSFRSIYVCVKCHRYLEHDKKGYWITKHFTEIYTTLQICESYGMKKVV